MPDLISLGEPMVEFNARQVGRLRDVKTYDRGWGGDTSNVICAAARLGCRTGYMTRIGDDEFGWCFMELWKREEIDTSHVIMEKDAFTGIYFISLKDGGEHDFTYYRANSASSRYSPEDLDPNYIRNAKIFQSSGITQAISQSCREAVFKAAQIAKDSGVLFAYDPNVRLKLWPLNTARAVIYHTFEYADIVMSSLEDARLITGLGDVEEIAEKLLENEGKIVALKLGAKGAIIVTETGKVEVPGYKVKVVDTTGCGDAWDGAFLVGILEGWSIEKSAKFANATAALKAKGFGAVGPLPHRREVEDFLKRVDRSW